MTALEEHKRKLARKEQKQQLKEFMEVVVETLSSIESKQQQEELSSFLVQIKEAIENIPEQKELDINPIVKAIKDIPVPKQVDINVGAIVDAIKSIPEVKIPEVKEIKFDKVIKAIPNQKTSLLAFKAVNKQLDELIEATKNVSISFSSGSKVDVVGIRNTDGDQIDIATETKQDDIISAIQGQGNINYSYIEQEVVGNYKYFGFKEHGGTNWKIMRKDLSTKKFQYAYGTDDYNDNWTDKETLTYTNP